MKSLLSIFLIVSISLFSGQCANKIEKNSKKKPTLLVIGLDHSLSMTDYPVWDKDKLKLICLVLNQNNSDVCICIKPIGNPSYFGFNRLNIYKVPEIDQAAVMSVRAKQKKEAIKVCADNILKINKFLDAAFLNKPADKKTCLNEFCDEVIKLVNEPQFCSYQIIVCLYSDGFPDSDGNNVTEKVTGVLPDNITLCTIGWRNSDKFSHKGNQYHFTDIEGFISYINSLTKNQ